MGINNPEIFLSLVLAIATVAYTIVTLFMLFESRKTRLQKTEPMLIGYIKSTDDHLTSMLCIKNIGEGCAENVRIVLAKDFNCFGKPEYPLSHYPLFRNGVSVFPSGYELHFYLDNNDNIKYGDDSRYLDFNIHYKKLSGKKEHIRHFHLPLGENGQNYSTPPETFEGQVPYYLKEIKKVLDNRLSKGKN